jgi:hypothetical protein
MPAVFFMNVIIVKQFSNQNKVIAACFVALEPWRAPQYKAEKVVVKNHSFGIFSFAV